jgi:hypothetical protein
LRTKTVLLLAFVWLGTMLACLPLFGDEGDPPSRVARLSYMDGAVSFEPSGENDWSQASLNYPLTTGDRLWTDKNARAELETGNVAIRMSAETDLTTTQLTDQLMQFGLAQGTVRVATYDLRSGHQIEIDTPNAALTIERSGSYRVETYPDQNRTLVTVTNGEVQVTGNDINQTVAGGQALEIDGTNPVNANWVQLPDQDSFDQWSNERDQRYERARSREYVSPEVPGYYDLDQYGSWNSVPEYGPVWYPSAVPVGWCPYRYGRWAWVEPWGWTWVDQEPWGFAPFHYGRWVQVGPRWGWLPGPIAVAPVYGPAFVAFVGGPGFSVAFGVGGAAAWFPLGPGEPFYPWYHHSDGYLREVNITNVRNVTNITNITNVTNINNVHYRYQTTAVTAVPAAAFRAGEPVARNVIKVSPQQIARAQVIPHPQITPTPKAITAGAPAAQPAVNRARPVVVQHSPVSAITATRNPAPANPRPSQPPAPNRPPTAENERTVPQPPARPGEVAHQNPPSPAPSNTQGSAAHPPPPTAERTPPPTAERTPPPVAPHNQPSMANNRPPANAGPPPTRPVLVGKTAPPPHESVPFQQRQPALQEHPGRPLEPQQRANIQQGRPAGPMQDREFPPHAGPVAPQHSSPPPRAAQSHPAPHSESKK